ncbi:class 1 fructose-bisphosphatase [bacterium]|nr:class 1 fructose-bisphosphatase [bacterium]
MSFKTIDRHIIDMERTHPEATGELSGLLTDIALAGKIIGHEVNRAGLVDVLGLTGTENVHGEAVKKLDIFSHDTLVNIISGGRGEIYMLGSEEMEHPLSLKDTIPGGKYIINFDPLDGSSNIDANVSVGTIFSILRKYPNANVSETDMCRQRGIQQVAAGYIIYGSSTMFVYTAGQGVHGFTLDPGLGEFILSHEHIQTPKRGKMYSINEGNSNKWNDGVRRYISYLKEDNSADKRPYSARYIGSLVADFHRNLLYGGIFLYPEDKTNPEGKLRLLYEANPLAMLIEHAGGLASDGHRRILEIDPADLHQRVPLIIGSQYDVELACKFIQGKIST